MIAIIPFYYRKILSEFFFSKRLKQVVIIYASINQINIFADQIVIKETASESNLVNFKGKVLEASSKKGVGLATVSLTSFNKKGEASETKTVVSALDGSFEFKHKIKGRYNLVVKKLSGYLTLIQNINLVNSSQEKNLLLNLTQATKISFIFC